MLRSDSEIVAWTIRFSIAQTAIGRVASIRIGMIQQRTALQHWKLEKDSHAVGA
jgi:hypothetical protein